MIDLHCHLLAGIDDGAPDIATSLAMARAQADQGVECAACTPHILPGLYHNTGPQIRQAVAALQAQIDDAGIPLKLVAGADNHVVPDFVSGIKKGRLLTIGDSPYVLTEPPHHVAPARLEDLFFNILVAGYIPILTHPERLSWIENKYDMVRRLAIRGVWMQITSGSLTSRFGRRPRYWAERMLAEGLVHLIATDAHDMQARPPDLLHGRKRAEQLAGAAEAEHLVVTRPMGILQKIAPNGLPRPAAIVEGEPAANYGPGGQHSTTRAGGGLGRRVRHFFG